MPKILSNASICNSYGELSDFCNSNEEAVFITKDGEGDLAVMSIDYYETISGKIELLNELMKGLQDVAEGRFRPVDEVFRELEDEEV